ncbi:MAG: hypothetical protein JSS12_03245, partial [Verrucomicrobia bacterium]|nr:hypothetical protein [Verrucomicrobiota bacterium]
ITRYEFLNIPFSFVEGVQNAGRTAVGVVNSLASAITGGKYSTLNERAKLTEKSAEIITPVYRAIVRVINPRANMENGYKEGVVSEAVLGTITEALLNAGWSKNVVARQIGTRLLFAVKAVAAIVTKAVDFSIGLVAATFSIVPFLGRSDVLNNIAVSHLTSTDVIDVVCKSLRGMVNPASIYKSFENPFVNDTTNRR